MARCVHRIRDSTKPHLTGCMKKIPRRFLEIRLHAGFGNSVVMCSHHCTGFCEGEVCPNVLLQSEFLCPGVFCGDAIHHEVAGIFGNWADMFTQPAHCLGSGIRANPVGVCRTHQEISGASTQSGISISAKEILRIVMYS